MTNEERRIDLSDKFRQMGLALLEEGAESDDFSIAQSGTILTLLSGLITVEDDIILFSELIAMFSAKKILDSMSGFSNSKDVLEILKKRIAEQSGQPKKVRKGRKPKDDDLGSK